MTELERLQKATATILQDILDYFGIKEKYDEQRKAGTEDDKNEFFLPLMVKAGEIISRAKAGIQYLNNKKNGK